MEIKNEQEQQSFGKWEKVLDYEYTDFWYKEKL